MKNLFYLFAITAFAFTVVSFTSFNNEKYPENLPSEYVEVLKGDFIKTMESNSLFTSIETNFVSLFDEVTTIDAQYSNNAGYYYLVVGSKNGQERFEILKTDKADIDNGTYTYIDFSNMEAMPMQFCSSGPAFSPFPFVCTGPCQVRTTSCLGAICGILVNGQCVNE